MMLFSVLLALFSARALVSARTSLPFTPTGIYGPDFPSLIDADLEDLKIGLERGIFTSVDLVKTYEARIAEVNSTLHMVTELNPDALSIAADLDAQRAKGNILGPLHGIPILIKNNIATYDKMGNSVGSWALVGATVSRDSTMAAKLRKAGAIILGKTNLSQWANYRSGNSSNGWSSHGGQTYGAYYPGQDPSGSSSGSGVASSLGLALASLGTETSGSILSPCEVNDLACIKPTVGLTSRYLVVPISERQDTIGPMARNIKDAAYLLQAIAGPDKRDNYTSEIPNNGKVPDYVKACDYNALAGARIGVARNVLDLLADIIDPPVMAAFNEAVKQIEAAGATIVDANFTGIRKWRLEQQLTVLNADFVVNLPDYLRELKHNPQNIKNLEDVNAFIHKTPAEEWPQRDTMIFDMALNQTWNNTDPEFWPAYQDSYYFGDEGGILGALRRSNTSAVLLPTHYGFVIPALVGSPVVSVPMGFYPTDWNPTLNGHGDLIVTGPNVPFGLSFMGPRFGEADLIGYAYAYEQRTLHRNDIHPYIAPNVELSDIVSSASLYGSDSAQKMCSKEWTDRCSKVSLWPKKMADTGATATPSWFMKLQEFDELEL